MTSLLLCATSAEWRVLKSQYTFDRVASGMGRLYRERSGRYSLCQTGIGPERALEVVRTILTDPPMFTQVVQFGLSGALIDDLEVGDLIIPNTLICRGESLAHEGSTIRALAESLRLSRIREGALLTVSEVLATPAQKRQLGEGTGAIAVDMESGPVAKLCHEHDLPYMAFRVVFDPVDWDLSDLVKAQLVKPDGQLDASAVLQRPLTVAQVMGHSPRYRRAIARYDDLVRQLVPRLVTE